MSDNYLKDLFIDEVKGALNLGGGGGITELPEHLQLGGNLIPISFKSDPPTSAEGMGWDNWLQCELFISTPNLNVNDSLVIDIRGHIYNGLESALSSSYFPQRVWGANFGDNGHTDDLPFSFWAHATSGWDEDGNHEHQYSMTFAYDAIKYPDLDVGTEVKFYIGDFKTLDPKYLPEHLQFGKTAIVLVEETVTMSSDSSFLNNPFMIKLVNGETYSVVWNGKKYNVTTSNIQGANAIGNLAIPGMGNDTGEPFCIAYMEHDGQKMTYLYAESGTTNTITITRYTNRKIDPKYLPYGNAEEASF